MNYKRFIKKLIVGSTVAIIIAIFLVNLINSFNFAFVAHNSDWIPFYGNMLGGLLGGIIGGIVTLKGVMETIEYNEKTRRCDEKKSIKPYLTLIYSNSGGSHIHDDNLKLVNYANTAGDSCINAIKFTVLNIGMGNAINIKLNNKDVSWQALVGKDQNFCVTIQENKKTQDTNRFELDIKFRDLLDNQYKQTFIIESGSCLKDLKISSVGPVDDIEK